MNEKLANEMRDEKSGAKAKRMNLCQFIFFPLNFLAMKIRTNQAEMETR